jgi:hypothetical protein
MTLCYPTLMKATGRAGSRLYLYATLQQQQQISASTLPAYDQPFAAPLCPTLKLPRMAMVVTFSID